MIASTPTRLRPSLVKVSTLSIPLIVVPNVLVFALLWYSWAPSSLLAIATLGLSEWKFGARVRAHFRRRAEAALLYAFHDGIARFDGSRGSRNGVVGIKPGTWVCLEKEHEDRCRENRR